jgi:lantibiotic modifying enzyme
VDARILQQANLPYLRDGGLRPVDYIEEIVDGFAEMYRFFMSKRTALAGRRGRLRELHNLSNRILFRPTRDYIAILNRSLHLRNLRNPTENRIEIDPAPKRFRAVIEAERAALQQLDVPYFPGRTNIKRAIARINAMGVRSLRRETRVMKTALLLKMLQQQTP